MKKPFPKAAESGGVVDIVSQYSFVDESERAVVW